MCAFSNYIQCIQITRVDLNQDVEEFQRPLIDVRSLRSQLYM